MNPVDKCMLKAYNNIIKNPPWGISVSLPDPDDFTRWLINMKGPSDTPYEHTMFRLDLKHNDDRFHPPNIKFIGRVPMHPNIDEDGTICLSILTNTGYSPTLVGETILVSIQSLLGSPNPYECLRSELGILFLEDQETYNTIIRMHCQGDDLLFNEIINDKKLINS